jgi:multiple sugar transport system substrate-binding protein
MGIALAACAPPAAPTGAGGQSAAGGAAVPAQAPVEIAYWDMVWGPPEYIDTGKKLIDQFNSEHPEIKATYQSTPWANWYQTFVTAIGSGTAPDISTGAAYQAADFYSQGQIAPVDDVVDSLQQAGKLDDFFPGAVDRLKAADGHYVALPWAIDVRIIFARQDLLDAAGAKLPTTWDEFLAAAKATTKADGSQYGYIVPTTNSNAQDIWLWLFDNGGGWFKEDRTLDVMSDRNVESMDFFANMVKEGVIHPGSAGFSGDDATKAYGQGGATFYINNPGVPDALPDVADKIVVTSPLTGPHGDKGTISWINNRMVYAQSKAQEQAKTLMSWLYDADLVLWTEGNCGQLTPRKSVAQNPHFQERPHLQKIYAEWLDIGKSAGQKAPGIFPELNAVEGEGYMTTLLTDLLQGKDVKESLAKAETSLKAIMKQ